MSILGSFSDLNAEAVALRFICKFCASAGRGRERGAGGAGREEGRARSRAVRENRANFQMLICPERD